MVSRFLEAERGRAEQPGHRPAGALRAAAMRLSAGHPGRCAPGRMPRLIRNSPVISPPVNLNVRLNSFTHEALSRGRPSSTRSEEHTSELQSLMRISYAVFCLNKINIHYH